MNIEEKRKLIDKIDWEGGLDGYMYFAGENPPELVGTEMEVPYRDAFRAYARAEAILQKWVQEVEEATTSGVLADAE